MAMTSRFPVNVLASRHFTSYGNTGLCLKPLYCYEFLMIEYVQISKQQRYSYDANAIYRAGKERFDSFVHFHHFQTLDLVIRGLTE